jgi:hypothetical protein
MKRRVPWPEQTADLIADLGLPTGNQEAEERLAGEGLIQALSSKSRIVEAEASLTKAAATNAPLRGLERAKVRAGEGNRTLMASLEGYD